MTKDKCFTVRMPKRIADTLKKYIPEKTGMTVNECTQAILFLLFVNAHKAADLDMPTVEHIETALDPLLFVANKEASRLLQCLREIKEGKVLDDSSPIAVTAILEGGVLVVIEPKHRQYTLNPSRAFELLLSSDPELAKLVKRCQTGHKGASLRAILVDLLNAECDFLERQQPTPITTIAENLL